MKKRKVKKRGIANGKTSVRGADLVAVTDHEALAPAFEAAGAVEAVLRRERAHELNGGARGRGA